MSYLTFTANTAGSTIQSKLYGTSEYSVDNGETWTTVSSGYYSDTITLENIGDTVLYRGTNCYTNANTGFTMTGSIAASGDVTSLLNGVGGDATFTETAYGQFNRLFGGCSALTSIPNLPSTTLARNCYCSMFTGCTGLTYLPDDLFNENINTYDSCYNQMFYNCTGLTSVPDFKMSSIARYACTSTFAICSNLKKLPRFYATSYGEYALLLMFNSCSKIKLSQTETDNYTIPFRLPEDGTGTGESYCFNGMFQSTGGTFDSTPSINTTYYAWKYCTASVSVNPVGSGTATVIEDPIGTFTFTATPASYKEFVNWTKDGTIVSTSTTYTVTPTDDISLVANFKGRLYINAHAYPQSFGTVTGTGYYLEDTSVTVTVTPNNSKIFRNWTKGINGEVVSTNTSYTFTATQDCEIVANMYMPFITNRTLVDVNRVTELNTKIKNGTATQAEITEWGNNLIGALNTNDLERNVQNISDISTMTGISTTTQTIGELPDKDWYLVLYTNVKTLRDNYIVRSTTSELLPQPLNTYEHWNIIEQTLKDIYEICMSKMVYYGGNDDMYCDDNVII